MVRPADDEWLDIVDWRSPDDFAASRAKGANLPGIQGLLLSQVTTGNGSATLQGG